MVLKTLSSGLQYQVIEKASEEAPRPRVGSSVTVHYTGWLNEAGKTGKLFDSSVDRNEKFTFVVGVGMVISGWDEGVLDMQVGEKRRLFISSDLAYGSHGAGGLIPPDADLIFDVELFDVS